jgi:GntR family transcriptional repressor for pyruvate dehydrogenase complex
MRLCLQRSRAAATWRQYEAWDNRLHRVIGEAAQNVLLLALLDMMNAVRRTVTWGRLRANRERPAPDHHSFGEHEAIVEAIAERDRARARDAMRAHLLNVERHLLAS